MNKIKLFNLDLSFRIMNDSVQQMPDGIFNQSSTSLIRPVFQSTRSASDDASVALPPRHARMSRWTSTAQLRPVLKHISEEAYGKTEALLPAQVICTQAGITKADLQAIIRTLHQIYDTLLIFYGQRNSIEGLVTATAEPIGHLRGRYPTHNAWITAFVGIQFQQVKRLILDRLPQNQWAALEGYCRVVDNYLCMPLLHLHRAAAVRDKDALDVLAVERLMPLSHKIAHKIAPQVLSAYPSYRSKSSALSASLIKASSVRDLELIQAYLWICVLEENDTAVERELLPVCEMLYPMLHISWELVRYGLMLLEHEIGRLADPLQWKQLKPYLDALKHRFSALFYPSPVYFC